jgi:uncharacterized pyridoxamine 5'-phosphate oxidase family protein
MKETMDFLNKCGTYYLASLDGDAARVRPFGAVAEFEGRMYFCTNSTKDVYRQMKASPRIEICAFDGEMKWLRLSGEAVFDDRAAAKANMLEVNPTLKELYDLEDGIFQVFYLENPVARYDAFGAEPEVKTL